MLQTQWTKRLVHYQFVADLLLDRRVLEIGCGEGQGAAFLASMAQHVTAVETSQSKLDKCKRSIDLPNVTFVTGEPNRLPLESRSVDMILVPELSRWITQGSFMPELGRLLVPQGLVLFAATTEETEGSRGMAYQDLVEYLEETFPHVQIFGEIPYHGTIVADFEPAGEIVPQLDCSLVQEDDPPSHYLALCCMTPQARLGYSVIQIPVDHSPLHELRGLRDKFDQLVEEKADGELKLEELRTKLAEAERRVLEAGVESRQELTGVRRETKKHQDQTEALRRELEEARAALAEALSLQSVGDDAVSEVVEELRSEMDAQRQLAQLELQQARQRLEQHVESSQRRIKQLEEELSMARRGGASSDLSRELDQAVAQIAELKALLAAAKRGEQVQFEEGYAATSDITAKFWAKDDPTHVDKDAAAGPTAGPTSDLERHLDREIARAEKLELQLQTEQDRLERARAQAEDALKTHLEERTRAETLLVKLEAAERALEESRTTANQNRLRAEGAERRCDSLVIRIEQGAGELSQLHQRLAEVQGMRQADAWQIDELTGRLREAESRGSGSGPPAPSSQALVQVQQRIRQLEQDKAKLEGELRRQERLQTEAEDDQGGGERVAEIEKRAAELGIERKQYADLAKELENKVKITETRQSEANRRTLLAEEQSKQVQQELERTRAALEQRESALAEAQKLVSTSTAELALLHGELEEERLSLARREDESRGRATFPDESSWNGWPAGENDDASDEGDDAEIDGYVGHEMEGEPEEKEASEEDWRVSEQLQMRDRQLEALLEGAALHREEMGRFQIQLSEMDGLVQELQHERSELESRLEECQQQQVRQQETEDQLRAEVQQLGLSSAQVEGQLKRYQEAGEGAPPAPRTEESMVGGAAEMVLRQDLEREIRQRQRLQEELSQQLAELDEQRRQLGEKDRELGHKRNEDTEHRAELRELKRQLQSLELQVSSPEDGEPRQVFEDLLDATQLLEALETQLQAEAARLANIQRQLQQCIEVESGADLVKEPST